jgi:DNA-binding CsgD family transcriptional regulator
MSNATLTLERASGRSLRVGQQDAGGFVQREVMSPPEYATLRFFQDAAQAPTLEQLTESFGACVLAHGFQGAACLRVATPGQPVQPKVLFAWGVTEWATQYMEQRLYRNDPSIQAIFTAIEPFSWDQVEGRSPAREAGAMFKPMRAAGAANGLVVPVHGPLGEVLAVTLVSATADSFTRELRQRMHVVGCVYATRGLTLMERELEPPAPDLTRREIQCVYWVAEGKSDWEIGRILEISEETVAWHVQNAKRKLGVARRAQLATAAWRRGVLLDESPD